MSQKATRVTDNIVTKALVEQEVMVGGNKAVCSFH